MNTKPLVYIAGRFRADDAWQVERNVRQAEEALFGLLSQGVHAYCPHTHTRFFDGALQDQVFLEHGIAMLERCDAVYLLQGYEHSQGSLAEVRRAMQLDIPVFRDPAMGSLVAWCRKWQPRPAEPVKAAS